MYQPNSELILTFSELKYPFRKWLEELWGFKDLENLHLHLDVSLDTYVPKVIEFQARCNEHANEILPLVGTYLQEVVEPQVGALLVVQAAPTFRAHFAVDLARLIDHERLAANFSTNNFLRRFYWSSEAQHLRGFHRDSKYGLPAKAVNVWTAMTPCAGTNALWIGTESDGGSSSSPVLVPRAGCMLFNGARRWHGTVCNTSGATRVSFDVRVLPKE